MFPRCLVLFLFGCWLLAGGSVYGQAEEVPILYPIQTLEDAYEGAGVDWLMERAKDRQQQFMLFGEQHGVRGMAHFVQFAYQHLHSYGFNRLVLETDAWTAGKLNEWGLDSVTQQYPFSIAFDYDGELDLIGAALAASPTYVDPIWGVDQILIAIHPFERLGELAADAASARLARGAFLKAALRMGNYIREDHFADLDQLDQVFAGQDDPEVRQILREIRISMEIYTTWYAGQAGTISTQVSVEKREQFMKEQLETYLSNMPRSLDPPRVIFKLGGAHTMYGVGPNGVSTLGEYVHLLAKDNGTRTLSISLQRYQPEYALVDSTAFAESPLVLLDLGRWRQATDSLELNKNQARIAHQFDAVIYFKAAPEASKSQIKVFEKDFRSRLIRRLIPLGVWALLGLTVVVPLVRLRLRRGGTWPKGPWWILALSLISLIVTIAVQILWIREFPSQSSAIFPASLSLWLYGGLTLAGIYFCLVTLRSWRKGWWNLGSRVHYLILVGSFLALGYLAYYWNLGGMLG
ncbi:MAG: hypothetical protein AAF804_12155 [Bacteroidota bacterium]